MPTVPLSAIAHGRSGDKGNHANIGVVAYTPAGYEFGSLVDGILDVSRGSSLLSEETRTALATLDRDVRLRVFSTPT